MLDAVSMRPVDERLLNLEDNLAALGDKGFVAICGMQKDRRKHAAVFRLPVSRHRQ